VTAAGPPSSARGGDVFRSGCCWYRGKGKVFYFRPGHETYPIYFDANVQRVITNACRWAARREGSPMKLGCTQCKEPLNPIRPPQEGQVGKRGST